MWMGSYWRGMLGKKSTAGCKRELLVYIHSRRKEWCAQVYVELRVQVSLSRFRNLDVCVVRGARPKEQILTRPPFLCIEILSPEDRISTMQLRVQDYLEMGVAYVWIIDPRTWRAWRCVGRDLHEVTELRTENPEIVAPLAALFEEED